MGGPRVFIGLQDISGYYQNLELGFKAIGVDARLVTTHPHPFGYSQLQKNPWQAGLACWAVLEHRRRGAATRPIFAMVYLAASLLLFLSALMKYQVFIFAWGESFLPRNVDLPLMKLLKKQTIVVVGHGSEARPPYMSNVDHLNLSAKDQLAWIVSSTDRMTKKLHRIEKYSSIRVGLRTTAQLLGKPFVDFFSLGLPVSRSVESREHIRVAPKLRTETERQFVVLHVPSNPKVKGTHTIAKVMKEFASEYPGVLYREITNVPHQQILEAIRDADLVLDQLWSDIPTSVVGLEAAAAGKACLTSGYAWDVWKSEIEAETFPPALRTTPERLREALEWAYHHRSELAEMGLRSREFVYNKWACEAVAGRYVRLLDGTFETSWVVSTSDVTYPWGVGVDQQTVIQRVAKIRDLFGWKALSWKQAPGIYSPWLGDENERVRDD